MPLTQSSVTNYLLQAGIVSLLLSQHSCANGLLRTHLNEFQNANTKWVLPFFLAKFNRIHVIIKHTVHLSFTVMKQLYDNHTRSD